MKQQHDDKIEMAAMCGYDQYYQFKPFMDAHEMCQPCPGSIQSGDVGGDEGDDEKKEKSYSQLFSFSPQATSCTGCEATYGRTDRVSLMFNEVYCTEYTPPPEPEPVVEPEVVDPTPIPIPEPETSPIDIVEPKKVEPEPLPVEVDDGTGKLVGIIIGGAIGGLIVLGGFCYLSIKCIKKSAAKYKTWKANRPEKVVKPKKEKIVKIKKEKIKKDIITTESKHDLIVPE